MGIRSVWVRIGFTILVVMGSAYGIEYNETTPDVTEIDPGAGYTTWDWTAGTDINVIARGGDAPVMVGESAAGAGPTTASMRNLTITGTSGGYANFVFGSGSPRTTINGSTTISGWDDTNRGALTVSAGSDLTANGLVTLGEYSTLEVEGVSSVFYARNGLIMTSAYGADPYLLVDNRGTVQVRGGLDIYNGTVDVSNGTLDVDNFWLGYDTSTVDGSILTVNNGGSFTISGQGILGNGTINFNTSGVIDINRLTVDNYNGVVNLSQVGAGSDANMYIQNGSVNVIGNVAFTSADGLTRTGSIENNGGTLTVDTGASLEIDSLVMASGASSNALIDGTVIANAVSVTNSGRAQINGSVTADIFAVSGTAQVTISNTAVVDAAMDVSGGTVNIYGEIADTSSINASGGTVNIQTGSQVGDYANGEYVSSLNVSGTGVVNVNSDASFGQFAMAGGNGTVNVDNGAVFYVAGSSTGLNGNLSIGDGIAGFGSDVSFSGGTLRSTNNNAAVVAGGRVTIGNNAFLDAGAANLTISASNLNMQGTYQAGYVNRQVTRVTVTDGGGLTVTTAPDRILMTSALQAYAGGIDFAGGETILVLQGDSTTGQNQIMEWDSGNVIYKYQMRQDADGKWGLYLYEAGELSDEERYQRLLARWNDRTGGHADNLITPEFGRVIRGAANIKLGLPPYDSDTYDNLTDSGKLNADALFSLSNTGEENVDYSALMLYNGSNLGQVNQAILDATGLMMRRVARRTSFVRNECYVASETVGPDGTMGQATGDLLKNRVWTSLLTSSENTASDKGFAGYKYRPDGIMVGYDRLFSNNVTLGGAIAYSSGDFRDKAALANDSTIDNYAFILYGGFNTCNGLFLSGALGYAYSENQIRDRRLLHVGVNEILEDGTETGTGVYGWNEADYNADSWMFNLNVGYDWRITDYLTLSPSLGFAYQHTSTDSHSQYFSSDDRRYGGNTLNAGSISNHSATVPLELAASYDLIGNEESMVTINANIGYTIGLTDRAATGKYSFGGLGFLGSVESVGRDPGRNYLTLGVGAKYIFRRFEFGLDYDYVGRTKFTSHNFTGSFGVNF